MFLKKAIYNNFFYLNTVYFIKKIINKTYRMSLITYYGDPESSPVFLSDSIVDFREETLVAGLDPK